jgi:lipoprotein-releasing system permease protein
VLFGINFRFIFLISVRYFFFSRAEKSTSIVSFLAVIGISLGVFALIIVMSVMNGFRAELISSMVSYSGEMSIVLSDPVVQYEQFVKEISALDFVKNVRPISLRYGLAQFNSYRNYVTVKGVESARVQIVEGTSKFLDYSKSVAVSQGLARSLNCSIDDKIRILDLTSLMYGEHLEPQEFDIKAIFVDSTEESGLILTSINSIKTLSDSQIGVSIFEIDTINPNFVECFAQSCADYAFLQNCKISTWKQLNPELLRALEIENVSMFIILSLIILVAVSNGLSSLIMTVKEKVYEIAILRTMGALRFEILLIFLLNGLAIGAIGIFIGTGLSCFMILSMPFIKRLLHLMDHIKVFEGLCYFLDRIPFSIAFIDVFEVVLFSFVLSLCATFYPAYKASSTDPASVLR